MRDRTFDIKKTHSSVACFSEILDSKRGKEAPLEKSPVEADFEKYCDRLKESYVSVSKELETYLESVSRICERVEQLLSYEVSTIASTEQLSSQLEHFDSSREAISREIREDISQKFENLLDVIAHEVTFPVLQDNP